MIHLIQNDAKVPAGYFGELLQARQIDHRTVHLHAGEAWPEVKGGDGVVVLGGYMGAHEEAQHPHLSLVVEQLYRLASLNFPVLGICLGAQLLAKALGAAVHADFLGERGNLQVHLTEEGIADPLFAGLSSPLPVLQWHHDSFELPQQAVRLAWSPACPNQAFRFGNAYAVQFHPEVTCEIVADWVRRKNADEEISREFTSGWEEHSRVAERMLVNFCRLCLERKN